jgi:hypothetical protein
MITNLSNSLRAELPVKNTTLYWKIKRPVSSAGFLLGVLLIHSIVTQPASICLITLTILMRQEERILRSDTQKISSTSFRVDGFPIGISGDHFRQ